MPVELPNSYESLYQSAIRQMAVGKPEQAIELLTRIVSRLCRLRPETLERKPNLQQVLVSAWSSAVEFLRWEKRYDQAIEMSESVLDRLPEPSLGRTRIASLMIEKGEVEAGLDRMRQMAERDQGCASWADLAVEYVALERYDEAEASYKTALSLAASNEDAALANSGLFRVYQEMDRVESALSAWDMAVVLEPDLANHVVEVYSWLIARGEVDRAIKYLERDRDPIRHTFYHGLIDWQAGRREKARKAWRSVLDTDAKKQSSALEVCMEAALRLGEPAKAIELTGGLVADGQLTSVQVRVLTGIANVMLDNADQAKVWFEHAVNRLRRGWPSREQIPASAWTLLTAVVSDEQALEPIAPYFEGGER